MKKPKNFHLILAVVIVALAVVAGVSFLYGIIWNCGKEGTTFKLGEDYSECCSDLVRRPNYKIVNSTCDSLTYVGVICTKCGDETCGTGENICNCPQDCGCKRNGDYCCSDTGCIQKLSTFGGQYWDKVTGDCHNEFWSCEVQADGKCSPHYDGCSYAQ